MLLKGLLKKIKKTLITGNKEKATNPFNNSAEEKVPTDENSFSEEYLPDNYKTDYFSDLALQFYKCENASTYIAFTTKFLFLLRCRIIKFSPDCQRLFLPKTLEN